MVGKIYDLTNKDYEKYVISDAVHIGWKGWVYVDQQIARHMDGHAPKIMKSIILKINHRTNITTIVKMINIKATNNIINRNKIK